MPTKPATTATSDIVARLFVVIVSFFRSGSISSQAVVALTASGQDSSFSFLRRPMRPRASRRPPRPLLAPAATAIMPASKPVRASVAGPPTPPWVPALSDLPGTQSAPEAVEVTSAVEHPEATDPSVACAVPEAVEWLSAVDQPDAVDSLVAWASPD